MIRVRSRCARQWDLVDRRWWAALGYLRVPQVAGVCLVTVLLCVVAPKQPVPVPGRLTVRAVVTNTLPVFPALFIVGSAAAVGVREAVSARGRLRVLVVLSVCDGAMIVLSSLLAWAVGVPTFGRNSLFLVSVGVGLSMWIGARAAGVAVTLLVTCSWMAGIDAFNEAQWWAWLMAPPDRFSAWVGVLSTALVAVAAVLVGPRRYEGDGGV